MTIVNQEADELLIRTCTSVQHNVWDIQFKANHKSYSIYNHLTKTQIQKKLEKKNMVLNKDYFLVPKENNKDFNTAVFIMERHIRRIHHMTQCSHINFWLSDTDRSNFRYKVAKTPGPKGPGYKAGRAAKPSYWYQLRDILIQKYAATEIKGYEADDALGIHQTEDTIASHFDKDISMIPGKHFRWDTGEFYEVSNLGGIWLNDRREIKGTGLAFFYAQLLMGDSTDNIPNLARGYGDVKVFKLLEECVTEKDMLKVVLQEYETVLGLEYGQRLFEQADLVWICRDTKEYGSNYLLRRITEYDI